MSYDNHTIDTAAVAARIDIDHEELARAYVGLDRQVREVAARVLQPFVYDRVSRISHSGSISAGDLCRGARDPHETSPTIEAAIDSAVVLATAAAQRLALEVVEAMVRTGDLRSLAAGAVVDELRAQIPELAALADERQALIQRLVAEHAPNLPELPGVRHAAVIALETLLPARWTGRLDEAVEMAMQYFEWEWTSASEAERRQRRAYVTDALHYVLALRIGDGPIAD